MKAKFSTTSQKVEGKFPALWDMGPDACLMTIARAELRQLQGLQVTPTRAIDLLHEEIKIRADNIIQRGIWL